jgi:hypothetical protein
LFVEKIWNWACDTFCISLKWCIRITNALFAGDIIRCSWFACFAIKYFTVPLRIYRAIGAILSVEEWIFLWACCAFFGIDMKNLTFWALFACKTLEVKIFWMDAYDTSRIVPKISFEIVAFAFSS